MNLATQKKEPDQNKPHIDKNTIKSHNERTSKSINTVVNPSKISGRNAENSNQSAMNGSICNNSQNSINK